MQPTGEDAAPSPATTDSRFAALQARTERWTELCNELSAHAAELQSVRDTLRPRARDADVQESPSSKKSDAGSRSRRPRSNAGGIYSNAAPGSFPSGPADCANVSRKSRHWKHGIKPRHRCARPTSPARRKHASRTRPPGSSNSTTVPPNSRTAPNASTTRTRRCVPNSTRSPHLQQTPQQRRLPTIKSRPQFAAKTT